MAARISATCSSPMPFAATVCATASVEGTAACEFPLLAAADVSGSSMAIAVLESAATGDSRGISKVSAAMAIGSALGATVMGAGGGGTYAGAALKLFGVRAENEVVAAPAAAALAISL